MARPIGHTAENTCETILSAMVDLLARKRLDQIKLAEVAAQAKVSVGTLTYYFPRKRDLVENCVRQYEKDVIQLKCALLAQVQEDCLDTAIPRALRYTFHWLRDRRGMVRLRMQQIVGHGGIDAIRLKGQHIPHLNAFQDAFAARLGIPKIALRLGAQAAMIILTRFSIAREDELVAIVGPTISEENALKVVEDYVVCICQSLLRGISPQTLSGFSPLLSSTLLQSLHAGA